MARPRQFKSVDECVVLHVEDDDATAYLFQIALAEADLWPRIFRVTDGEQALAFLLRTGAYKGAPASDLVLLDLNLPRKGGFEVLAYIRDIPALSELPVVVFSTSAQPEDRERAFRLGATEYFSKPDDFDKLVEIAGAVCRMLPRGPVLRSA